MAAGVGILLLLGLSILDSIDSDAAGAVASSVNPRAPVALPSGKPSIQPKMRPIPIPTDGKAYGWKLPKTLPSVGPVDVNGFQLIPQGDALLISYFSKNPALILDPAHPPVVVLRPTPPTDVEPSMILAPQWPKGSNAAKLKLVRPPAGTLMHIRGSVSFRYCKVGTKDCKQAIRKLSLDQ